MPGQLQVLRTFHPTAHDASAPHPKTTTNLTPHASTTTAASKRTSRQVSTPHECYHHIVDYQYDRNDDSSGGRHHKLPCGQGTRGRKHSCLQRRHRQARLLLQHHSVHPIFPIIGTAVPRVGRRLHQWGLHNSYGDIMGILEWQFAIVRCRLG